MPSRISIGVCGFDDLTDPPPGLPMIIDRTSAGVEPGRFGVRYMPDPTNQMQHVAMATYADVDRLDLTLRELAADAVPLEQVCLVGCAPHIEAIKMRSVATPPSYIQSLLDRAQTIATLSNGAQLVVAPQPFACIDFDRERQAQGLLHGLDQMLIDGVLALLVKSRSIAEFVAVARALLRYSSHRVRTRQVADRFG